MGIFSKKMIMKSMILALSLISFVSSSALTQNTKGLTRAEKRFVNNVIKAQKEKPVEITKRTDNHIVVEFSTTMVILKPDGFIGEVWILGDEDWISLGTEQSAY